MLWQKGNFGLNWLCYYNTIRLFELNKPIDLAHPSSDIICIK